MADLKKTCRQLQRLWSDFRRRWALTRAQSRSTSGIQRLWPDLCRWWSRFGYRRLAVSGLLFVLAIALQAQVILAAESNMRQAEKERAAIHSAAASRGGETAGTAVGYKASRGDVILMARVIEGEAADEPYRGKVAVGAVIVNRTEDPRFPRTIRGVVYQPNAFEAVDNGQIWRPLSTESVRAAEDALAGRDPTKGAVYYWNPYKRVNPWVWSRPVHMQIGNHVFAR
ncbi:MAG: cell wall hydrolase [Bacillota bacterium]|nr:cell wall hydrolase [Bacillota bacterium]